jgi:molybdopterin converting factor small subunit
MSVKIHLYSGLPYYTRGQHIIEVDGNTVGECLADLVKRYPEISPSIFEDNGQLQNTLFVSINLESPYPEPLTQPLKDGDHLYVIVVVAGG